MIELKNQSEQIPIFHSDTNHQLQQIRCRICYYQHKPLVNICQCDENMRYMHIECATNWIGKKIEQNQRLKVPKCQVCHKYYHAQLIIKEKTVNFKLLLRNIKTMKIAEIFQSFIFMLGSLVAIWLLIVTFIRESYIFFNYLGAKFEVEEGSELKFQGFFISLMYPITFLTLSFKNFKKCGQVWQLSKIQVIQLTLHPMNVLSE